MNINTSRRIEEEMPPQPEKSRPPRRKVQHKLRRGRLGLQRLRGYLPALGRSLLVALLAGALFALFDYAYSGDSFELQSIEFTGNTHADVEEMERAMRASYPSNILAIDLYRLQQSLEESRWVKRAEIRRVLPSKLVVLLQERVPSVVIEIQGDMFLTDDEGILLDRFDGKYGRLDVPVFRGLVGENAGAYAVAQTENSHRVQLGRRMLAELEAGSPLLTRNISEVDLSERNNVRVLLLDDTAEILLGERDFLRRFRNFISNMEQYEELKSQYQEISSVDLRYEGQIIYRPRRVRGFEPETTTRKISTAKTDNLDMETGQRQ